MNPYLVAMRQPLAILVLLVAIGSGLSIALWLLPLGLLVYVAAVALAGRDPTLAQQAQRAQRVAARGRLNSVTFRTIMDEVDRSQRAVLDSIDQSSGPLNRILQSVRQQTEMLLEQANDLAHKGQIIEQYLATNDPSQLQAQIDNLDIQLSGTSDSYTLQQLQQTREALVDRQANAQALQTYIGRITAQLQNIDANLDNVLAETVRLRTADSVSADSTSNQVAQHLSDLNADMNAFQRVLDTAMSQSGAAA